MDNFYKGLIFIIIWCLILGLIVHIESIIFDYCSINECCSTTGSIWQRALWQSNPMLYLIGLGIGIRIGTIRKC